jgi:hypothetical protein
MGAISRRRRRSSAHPAALLRPRDAVPPASRMGFAELSRLFAMSQVWERVVEGFRGGPPRAMAESVAAAFDEADELALSGLVATLLGPETARIRFMLGEARVDEALFARVAEALRAGSLTAVALPPGDNAPVQVLFSPTLDAFCLRDPARLTPAKRALIVHHGVQAGLHLGLCEADMAVQKSAARIAEAMHAILAGEDAAPPRPAEAHAALAMRLAARLLGMGAGAELPSLAPADPDAAALVEIFAGGLDCVAHAATGAARR